MVRLLYTWPRVYGAAPCGQKVARRPPARDGRRMAGTASILSARCKQGRLIITDDQIRIENAARQQAMPRSMLTAVAHELKWPSIFGLGGAATLIFHGQGGASIQADLVPPKKAQEVLRLLGY